MATALYLGSRIRDAGSLDIITSQVSAEWISGANEYDIAFRKLVVIFSFAEDARIDG